jgi:hypothetical protein
MTTETTREAMSRPYATPQVRDLGSVVEVTRAGVVMSVPDNTLQAGTA